MILPLALFTQLAGACAPRVAPGTLAAVAATESRFDPLAIFDNTTHTAWRSRGQNEALALARHLIGAGHLLDLGLMQIDSGNLARLHLTVARAFDPCASLRAGAAVLIADYEPALAGGGGAATAAAAQRALGVAFSRYNTGSAVRGFRNGYVARVVAAARYVVPEITVSPAPTGQPPGQPVGQAHGLKAHAVLHRVKRERDASPGWQVFGAAAGTAAASSSWDVFPQSVGPGRLPGLSTSANPSNRGPQHE